MAMNPNSLANLRKFTPEGAAIGQAKGVQTRLLQKEIRENFKLHAVEFAKIVDDIPELNAVDVLRMCIHLALQNNDYAEAAKLAGDLAEYQRPKLARIEQHISDDTKELSDAELEAEIAKLHVVPESPKVEKKKPVKKKPVSR
jgi:hypothetical protein